MDVNDLAAWLGERLDKLESKVDGVGDHCAKIDVTLAGQAKDVAYHKDLVAQVALDLKPIQEHVTVVKGVAALLGFAGALLAIYKSVWG